MLSLPSLQKEYTLCWSHDPALDLPEVPKLGDDATAAQLEDAKKAAELREHKLKVARDHGNWPAITKPGQRPTTFRFRQVYGHRLTWWQSEAERNQWTGIERCEWMIRLALIGVDNLGTFKVKTDPGGLELLSLSSLDELYSLGQNTSEPELGQHLIIELGSIAMKRAFEGVPPLS